MCLTEWAQTNSTCPRLHAFRDHRWYKHKRYRESRCNEEKKNQQVDQIKFPHPTRISFSLVTVQCLAPLSQHSFIHIYKYILNYKMNFLEFRDFEQQRWGEKKYPAVSYTLCAMNAALLFTHTHTNMQRLIATSFFTVFAEHTRRFTYCWNVKAASLVVW